MKAFRIWAMPLAALALASCTGGRVVNSVPDGSGTAQSPNIDTGNFVALTPDVYANKVKTLLTGSAATDAEIAAIVKDPNTLQAYVATWIATPASRHILENFFADAFQQSASESINFLAIGDGQETPEPQLVMNFRQSFAKTVTALNDAGAPFTSVANTRSFMMTTAMLSWIAFQDTQMGDDTRQTVARKLFTGDPYNFTLTDARGPITFTDAANPAGVNYMTFSVADTNTMMAGADPYCRGFHTFSFHLGSIWLSFDRTPQQLYDILHGASFNVWDPGQFVAPAILCNAVGQTFQYLNPNDYNDWHMVTIRAPASGEAPTTFFDLPTLRNATTVKLYTPSVGYFTTPAFLGQWSTNASNDARVTANQTLIAGLGFQVDGTDTLPLTSPSAVSLTHAATPACFSCHQTLDPLRQFFRQSYTIAFSQQANQTVAAVPAAFAFRGAVATGTGVGALGDIIAAHPDFALAWTVKLCSWANSSPCLATDLEVVRIAQNFAASNFQFATLLQQVATSPLVTYAEATRSVVSSGQNVTLARRAQFCAILNARLGLNDVCLESQLHVGGSGSIAELAANMPADGYSRGVTQPMYVTAVDPFSRANIESICAKVAALIVDSGSGAWISSSDPNAAVQKITTQLMGVPAADSAEPLSILSAHYTNALAAGYSATQALQSTFILGCASPTVISIGQ